MRLRSAVPLLAAAVGLAGALIATLALHHAALNAVDRVLEQRLLGAGEAAAPLLGELTPTPQRLLVLLRANELDGAYVLGEGLRIVADAEGGSGGRADLLRVDVARVKRAFAGEAGVGRGYAFGALQVMTGYFPIRRPDGSVVAVLALEAGQSFISARAEITRARNVAVSLSVIAAFGVALLASRWTRAERARAEAAARAARGDALSRVAAMAAHEIRNPLGVIRGTIDLMKERSGAALGERDQRALGDIIGEVERLRRLTQELTDLASERPLELHPVDLGIVLDEAARATEAAFPSVKVRCQLDSVAPVVADGARLRQVFANLLSNGAQAQGPGEIQVRLRKEGGVARILIRDGGPGIPDDLADRIFDLYFTTKTEGTGLGLAIARRIVEQHGGAIVHRRDLGPGTAFEISLPLGSSRSS